MKLGILGAGNIGGNLGRRFAASGHEVCTDDAEARGVVNELGRQIGFVPVDLGPLRNARLAEHLALAWIHLAMKSGLGRDISLQVAGLQG